MNFITYIWGANHTAANSGRLSTGSNSIAETSPEDANNEKARTSDEKLTSDLFLTPQRPARPKSRDASFQSVDSSSSTSSDFSPCRSTPKKIDIPAKVTQVLEAQLGTRGKITGWVYVISHPEEPDIFKVGYSETKRGRYTSHNKCYPGFGEVVAATMPHAFRMERAIHTEFWTEEQKMIEKCSNCKKSAHREWLRVDKETLISSFWKWYEFANSEPYTESGNLRNDAKLPPPADKGRRKPSPRKRTPNSGRKPSRRSSSPPPMGAPDSPLASRSTGVNQVDDKVSSLTSKFEGMDLEKKVPRGFKGAF